MFPYQEETSATTPSPSHRIQQLPFGHPCIGSQENESDWTESLEEEVEVDYFQTTHSVAI